MALSFRTAGESHGLGVYAFLDGLPHGVPLGEATIAAIDAELRRRQGGHGRGARMNFEKDHVQVVAGVRHGRTIGSPVVLVVANKDTTIDRMPDVTAPRPGHADLAGAFKYGLDDVRDVLERSSARETAGRVAAGGLAQVILRELGITVVGYVRQIGEVALDAAHDPERRAAHSAADIAALVAARDASAAYCPDPDASERMCELIDRYKADGDSLGGTIGVIATGVPPGLGAHTQWTERLDGRLAQALMSIQAMKAVEIGAGVDAATLPGSDLHDPILPAAPPGLPWMRPSNRAGGIEGGMTNGMPLVCRVTMKPIPTLRRPLPSVDLRSGEVVDAAKQRTDSCSVSPASVVAQSAVALVLLDAILQRFGGDTFDILRQRYAREAFRVPESWAIKPPEPRS